MLRRSQLARAVQIHHAFPSSVSFFFFLFSFLPARRKEKRSPRISRTLLLPHLGTELQRATLVHRAPPHRGTTVTLVFFLLSIANDLRDPRATGSVRDVPTALSYVSRSPYLLCSNLINARTTDVFDEAASIRTSQGDFGL